MTCPLEKRQAAWQRLVEDLDMDKLASMTNTIGLGDVVEAGGKILKGEVQGRLVIDVNG